MSREPDLNVVGGKLLACSTDPTTGFYRDGCCATGPEDVGSHTVCSIVTPGFLEFSLLAGNDLSMARGLPRRLRPGRRAWRDTRPGARGRSDRDPDSARVPTGPR